MRIASNKIADIAAFFRNELSEIYASGEIETFLAYCLGDFSAISKTDLLLEPGRTVSESDLLKYSFAVKDLKKGKPIQYILGNAHFFGYRFQVNEHVLIPRPETEELVRMVIDDASKRRETISILDIGTGSGCIAISLKKKIPLAHVYAMDVSHEALVVAKKNAGEIGAEIHFIEGSLFDESCCNKVPHLLYLVSNPPYVKRSEADAMERNVKEFEPASALFVPDDDALVFYRGIADLGKAKLKPGGKIFVEINAELGLETAIVFQRAGYEDVRIEKDMQGRERFIICTLR